MSRRILDFDGQTTSMQWCEPDGRVYVRDGGSLDHARSWHNADSFREKDFRIENRNADPERVKGSYDIELMYDWISRICDYTERDVTLPTDRILAIASVAEKVGKLTNATYLAGLWAGSLPWMLMWSMKDRDTRPPRPTVYQGPSWSWTAVSGQIHCYYPLRLREEAGKVRCEIVGYDLDPEYSYAPFGSLKSATLVLKAKACRARWLRSEKVKRGGDYDNLAYHPQDRPLWSLSQEAHASDTETRRSNPGKNPIYTPRDLLPAKLHPDALEPEFATPVAEGGADYLDVILLQCFRHEDEPVGLVIRNRGEGIHERVGIFTTAKGQNYRYATDDGEHEAFNIQDSDADQEDHGDEEADEGDNQTVIMTEVKRLGSAWEKQLRDEAAERKQKQWEEEDWKRFTAWFDENDCEEQVFVLV